MSHGSAISWNELKNKIKLYLTVPGNGVYTVHTAKEKKDNLFKKLFQTTDNVHSLWEKSLENLPLHDTVILGLPSDTGGGIQRGANWGPLFLRDTMLRMGDDLKAYDVGDVRVIPHLLHDKYLNQETIENCRKALYNDKMIHLPVSPLSIAYDFAKSLHQVFPSKRLFTIGGDHSASYPVVRAFLEEKKARGVKVALIHFDAHTDLLTERLGIDICFGTWTAQVLPYLDSPDCLIQLGIRSSGKERTHWENTFGHRQYWSSELVGDKATSASDEIVEHLKSIGVQELYISFDIDCLDQSYAGATGTPEPGGLSPYEPMLIMQKLFENFPITGADMMEIAPQVKASDIKQMEPETTLMVAAHLSIFLIQAMSVKHRGVSA